MGKYLNNKLFYRILFRNRWWQHILFWVAAFILLASIFSSSSEVQKIDLIYTSIFIIPLLILTYLNLYLCIPFLLRRELYIFYLLASALLVWLSALILYHLFDSWIDHILPGYYFIAYLGVSNLLIYTVATWLITTLLKLSRSWFMLLRLEKEQSGAELRTLKSQVNPHFLLNSLHTIYGLSMKQSEDTPAVILQLSDILKYTLYETEKEKVKLEDELQVIRDYLELHRHRVDPGRVSITMNIEGDPSGKMLAPMLFLPFIENSFKHGVQAFEREVCIDIAFDLGRKDLFFRILNTKSTEKKMRRDKGGIGIANTRKRLELLYPGRHELKISEEKELFIVELKLKLN